MPNLTFTGWFQFPILSVLTFSLPTVSSVLLVHLSHCHCRAIMFFMHKMLSWLSSLKWSNKVFSCPILVPQQATMRPSSIHRSPASAWGTPWVRMPAMLGSIPTYQHSSSHWTQAETGSKLGLRPVLCKSIPTVVEPIITDGASQPT